ncbi:BamA/TamA family outer membrane protein [Undibacterium sp. Jales W-56]|uniref:autotransporter assembly complex protein TamA n=1 Tax=Undibacterium sp. Jales W-56 TaxID=2897325 RepID=UPI0021D2A0FC|nr:BamA/TamA family outer membrane protein [Undibacterium sp. Jales W-56]MCU6435642.1 BamA/TamA family outer membrane protein [Undibacterium sp. Jales W-56]
MPVRSVVVCCSLVVWSAGFSDCLASEPPAFSAVADVDLHPVKTPSEIPPKNLEKISEKALEETSATELQTNASSPAKSDEPLAEFAEDASVVSASAQRFQIGDASGDWLALIKQHIPELASNTDPQNVTPTLLRKLRLDIGNILATEGYFSPVISFDARDKLNGGHSNQSMVIYVNIDAGSRTLVKDVKLQFSGALADAAKAGQADALKRQNELTADWGLATGAAFRDEEWDNAKTALTETLRADVYAAASIVNSNATIDADSNSATLAVEIDSGPPFTLGEITVTGLQRFPAWLLERYQAPKKGEAYSRSRLLEYQRALQNSAYFSTVTVNVDTDPAKADSAPVEVSVVERKARDLGFGAGYSSNTGFRAEVSYRDRDILSKAWDLRSAVRIEQKRQLGYADIYLPPRDAQFLDSFGVLADRQDISGLVLTRTALGIKRTSTRNHLEQRIGVNLLREKVEIDGGPLRFNKALVTSVGWTWRDVDDSFAPRKGQIAQLDLAFSEKALLSDQRFIRTYAKYQRWIPVAQRDSIILRAEVGQVLSQSRDGIPEEYLFRTGGSSTVRGYAYQSLGIQNAGAVTGGKVMGVASAEYVHWTKSNWGAAAFLDLGDAADNWRDHSAKQGYGIGGRYKTPAGPVALDLAYGKNIKKFRLDFSIAIAF